MGLCGDFAYTHIHTEENPVLSQREYFVRRWRRSKSSEQPSRRDVGSSASGGEIDGWHVIEVGTCYDEKHTKQRR